MDKSDMEMDKLIEYLDNRIRELNRADEAFCKDRWDMSKMEYERNLAREMSNNVTGTRQELQSILRFVQSMTVQVTDEEIEVAGLELQRRIKDRITTFNWTFKEGTKWMRKKLINHDV